MNSDKLEIGQILWLKVRYQIDVVSTVIHPMLIAKIESDYIEVIAIDKTFGKMHQLYHNYNYYIDSNNPNETVISEDSYAQLNTKLTIDKIEELKSFRKSINNGIKIINFINLSSTFSTIFLNNKIKNSKKYN